MIIWDEIFRVRLGLGTLAPTSNVSKQQHFPQPSPTSPVTILPDNFSFLFQTSWNGHSRPEEASKSSTTSKQDFKSSIILLHNGSVAKLLFPPKSRNDAKAVLLAALRGSRAVMSNDGCKPTHKLQIEAVSRVDT